MMLRKRVGQGLLFGVIIFLLLVLMIEAYSFYRVRQYIKNPIISVMYDDKYIYDFLSVSLNQDSKQYRPKYVSSILAQTIWLELFESRRVIPQGITVGDLVANQILQHSQVLHGLAWSTDHMIIATWLTRNLTESQLMSYYLAHADFGFCVHGIEQAAIFYYGKPLAQLNHTEKSYLVTLLKSPSRYNPYTNRIKLAQATQDINQKLKLLNPQKYIEWHDPMPTFVMHLQPANFCKVNP